MTLTLGISPRTDGKSSFLFLNLKVYKSLFSYAMSHKKNDYNAIKRLAKRLGEKTTP